MKSYREYLLSTITKRNADIKIEAFRRAVLAAAGNGDRERVLTLRKLHEHNVDEAYPEDEACLAIADAALVTMGSEELQKTLEDQKALDALFELPVEDFLAFFKSLTLEQKKALNVKLAEHK
jgi:hypothetical protein